MDFTFKRHFKSFYCLFLYKELQKYETVADTTDAMKLRISHDQNSATEKSEKGTEE